MAAQKKEANIAVLFSGTRQCKKQEYRLHALQKGKCLEWKEELSDSEIGRNLLWKVAGGSSPFAVFRPRLNCVVR